MSAEKREHILLTAMRLFNDKGFHATPTSLIAKKAKVSVGTLFNYFKTKEELIEAIYIHIKLHSKMSFIESFVHGDSIHDTLKEMWKVIVVWGTHYPEEFNYLELFCHSPFQKTYKTEKSLEAYKQFQIQILKIILPDTLYGQYPDFILRYIDNAIHATTRFLLNNEVSNLDHFIENAFELLWVGFSHQDLLK